jgi:ABC-2 type transport system ATP-binding protein
MNAVEIEQVTKTFGRQVAVNDLSVVVPLGSVYGFIGPNGSGKTTTLRMIMRIFYPDRGRISVLGGESHTAADDRVGYLPEERGLYKNMKMRDVLRFYSRLKGHTPTREEIDGWIEQMGLTAAVNKKVQQLSKGMAQKVQFIATVISRPQLVLLDEPFSGLDPVNAVVLRDMVLRLRRDGTTIIFSTHDMAVAEQMCDRLFMIYNGTKVLDGTLRSIQQTYGADTIRLRVHNSSQPLTDLPGVVKVTDYGNLQELRITPGTDPQRILAALIQRGAWVEYFEVAHPSLHDIFVRIATPAAATPAPAIAPMS